MAAEMFLYNFTERMVEDCLEEILSMRPDAMPCSCARCKAMVQAHALSNLPTFYVTGKVGEAYAKYRTKQQQLHADVAVAISRGIEHVKGIGHS